MNWVSRIALILVIVGAINWLLVGALQWDLVTAIFGGDTVRASSGFSRLIYVLVGLAGLYSISFLFNDSKVKS